VAAALGRSEVVNVGWEKARRMLTDVRAHNRLRQNKKKESNVKFFLKQITK
jgi:hypothetical protein